MRRGVFGGSFDPVHRGHLAAAEAAAARLNLDVVHLVPASRQPFKRRGAAAAGAHRLAMLRAALAGHPRLVADDRELRRGGVSYTVDTLRELTAEFPEDALVLLIGADAARELPQWREAEALGRLARIAVLTRPGAEGSAPPPASEVVVVPAVDVSATEIRARVRRGERIADAVPPAVAQYIEEHGLYRSGT